MECTDSTKNIVKKIGPAIYPIFENAHGKAKLNIPKERYNKNNNNKRRSEENEMKVS